MTRPLLAAHDPTEAMTLDDQASLREQQHLQAALSAQAKAAAVAPRSEPGRCSNCGALLTGLPRAVYCDADCRADHEARLQALARAGRA